MMTGAKSRRYARLAGVVALAGLTAACASPQSADTFAPAGYGKDDMSRAERLVQYCDRLTEKGELVTALGLCARANELDPDNPETLMKVAAILQKLGRLQAAAQTYGLLLERHPGHPEARYNLGKLYMEAGEESLAALHFSQAIESSPDDPRAYNALGILKDQAGEHLAAQELYRSALERDPENLSARNNLGLSLALNGQRDEAIEVLAELAVDPEANQTVLRNLEAAYATGSLPANAAGVPGPATAMEAMPAAELPAAADPVEVETLNTRPLHAIPMPHKAAPAPAPTVEVSPPAAPSGEPVPLYPPKPAADRTMPRSIESRFGRTPSTSSAVTTPREPAGTASDPSSTILAAAEELMQPPAWADFDPGYQPAIVPQENVAEAASETEVVAEEAPADDAAKAAEEPKPGTARFNSVTWSSSFSNI